MYVLKPPNSIVYFITQIRKLLIKKNKLLLLINKTDVAVFDLYEFI